MGFPLYARTIAAITGEAPHKHIQLSSIVRRPPPAPLLLLQVGFPQLSVLPCRRPTAVCHCSVAEVERAAEAHSRLH